MLYYIKHEIIGDYVQQIQDGIPSRYCNMFTIILINFLHKTFHIFITNLFLSLDILCSFKKINCPPNHQSYFFFIIQLHHFFLPFKLLTLVKNHQHKLIYVLCTLINN